MNILVLKNNVQFVSGMPPKKKLRLSGGDEARNKANERFKRYREKIKNDHEKDLNNKEKAKERARRHRQKDKELRNTSVAYREAQRCIWRRKNEERKSTKKSNVQQVEWEQFLKESSNENRVLSQRKRRRRERQAASRKIDVLNEKNEKLTKKIKNLQAQLWRKQRLGEKITVSKPESAGGLIRRSVGRPISKKALFWKYRIQTFLSNDDSSKFLPGQTIIDKSKFATKSKKRSWRGKRVAKRVLRYKMKDCYVMFKNVYPNFPYSMTTFFKMRPVNIVTAQKGAKKIKCVCTYHSNVSRKVSVLNKFCRQHKLDCLVVNNEETMSNLTICSSSTGMLPVDMVCINRQCSSCGPELILNHYFRLIELHSQTVFHWTKWENVSRKVLDKKTGLFVIKSFNEVVRKSGFLNEVLDELIADLKGFPLHIFRAKWQRQELRNIQQNLPENDVLMVADFSENLQIQFSEETIASHVKSSGVSLLVAAIYRHANHSTVNEPKILFENYNFFSDSSRHDHHFVHHCTSLIMNHLNGPGHEKDIQKLHRYTDGCSSQFRSRHCLRDLSYSMNDFGVEQVTFNYGETSEFKNVTDGLGGVVKKLISDSVLCDDELVLSSPKDIVNYAKNKFQFVKSTSSNISNDIDLDSRYFFLWKMKISIATDPTDSDKLFQVFSKQDVYAPLLQVSLNYED